MKEDKPPCLLRALKAYGKGYVNYKYAGASAFANMIVGAGTVIAGSYRRDPQLIYGGLQIATGGMFVPFLTSSIAEYFRQTSKK